MNSILGYSQVGRASIDQRAHNLQQHTTIVRDRCTRLGTRKLHQKTGNLLIGGVATAATGGQHLHPEKPFWTPAGRQPRPPQHWELDEQVSPNSAEQPTIGGGERGQANSAVKLTTLTHQQATA